MESFQLLAINIASLLFSTYFVNARLALIIALKSTLEIDINPGLAFLKLKKTIKTNPSVYFATITVGIHLAAVTFIVSFMGLLIPFSNHDISSRSINVIIITLLTIFCAFIFGILIPKYFIHKISAGGLTLLLIPIFFFKFIFYPVISFSLLIIRLLAKNHAFHEDKNPVFGIFDIDWIEDEKYTTPAEKKESIETEVKLLKNALDFSKVKLREIMVPRTEIEMLDVHSTFNELHHRFAETGYSRIIFYDGNIDNIVGYVHSSVIFKNPESLKPYINNVLIVPETMPANKLLSTFIREHRSIAIVVDEFGGTSGMVTSEDILEEIFGEIEDEHDTIDIIEKKLSETEFIFSGRSEIDLINEKYQLNLPESEDFETVAGFILFYHESIPKINTTIKISTFQFKILKATNTKIELVKLTII